MASAIIPYPSIDDRLNIESSVAFSVLKGAQSINQQKYSATSISPSTININAVIPSLSTIVDREFLVETSFTIAVTGIPANNARLLNFGTNAVGATIAPTVLNSFPFSRLQNQAILQLNSSTFTMNMESEFDIFYKMMSDDDLDKYMDFTPVGRDVLLQKNTSALNQPIVNSVRSQYAGAYQSATYKTTRGSFLVTYTNNTADANYPNPLGNGTDSFTAKFQVTTTEPVFISPLVWAYSQNNAGMTGISALNLTFNLLNNADRAFRSSTLNPNNTSAFTTQIQSIDTCTLLVNLLTAPPTQLMPLTQSLSYFESPVYKTSIENGVSTVTSSTISPNNVPDAMYLAIRKRIRSSYDVDGYMPITGVNITFGTNSGILSNANQRQLYQISKEAGLNMSFEEFSGHSQISVPAQATLPIVNSLTCGGFLCIPFGLVIPNQDAFTSCGSIGSYSLQVTVNFDNSMIAGDFVTSAYELLVVLQSSGVVVTSQGQTSTFIGLVDRNTVLSMGEEQHPQPKRAIGRLLGGGLFSSLKSMALPLAKALAPMARQALATSENKQANKLHQELSKVGLGRPRHR